MPFYLNQDGGVYLRLGSPPAFDVRVKPYPVTGGGVGIDVPSQTYNISDIVNEVVPGNGAFGFTAQERIVTDNSETVAEFIADQARAFFTTYGLTDWGLSKYSGSTRFLRPAAR